MLDKLVSGALHLVVMTIIATLAAGALVCAHWGVVLMIGGAAKGAWGLLAGGAAAAAATAVLIRYRNDLVDR